MSESERSIPEEQQLPKYLVNYLRERRNELESELDEVNDQEAPEPGTAEHEAYRLGIDKGAVFGRSAELVGILSVIGAYQEMERWEQGEVNLEGQ